MLAAPLTDTVPLSIRSPSETFPGGCFFAGAVLEMGSRAGPVKERIAEFQNGLSALIREYIVTALEQRELSTEEDPDELTFELNGIILAANANFVLRNDPEVLRTAKRVVRRRLGVTKPGAPQPAARRPSRRARPA